MKIKEDQYYIVRCAQAGVFAGNIKERNKDEVTLTNARRIWYWEGAASLSQLAKEGTSNPTGCKFTVTLDELLVMGAIEIIPCTAKAEESIKGVREWRM